MRKPSTVRIEIPAPCHEDWNKMTIAEQGKFCDACQKCVIDFSSYTDKQLYDFFSVRGNKPVCGRYKASQLNRDILKPAAQRSNIFRYAAGMVLTVFMIHTPAEQVFAKALYTYSIVASVDDNEHTGSTPYTIKGCITEKESKQPLADVTVTLLLNGEALQNVYTGADGNYQFTIDKKGKYELLFSALTYHELRKQVNVQKSSTMVNTVLIYDPNSPDRMIMGGMIAPPMPEEVAPAPESAK